MTKLFENEHVELHENLWTEHLNRELWKIDENGVSFSDHKCFLARYKNDGFEEYTVMDGNMKPVIVGEDRLIVELLIKNLRWEIEDKLNIRNMAQTREVPRVV